MPTNDFKAFATGGGALVLSQADWLALAGTTIADGFQAGIADPATCNKLFRQASFVAAALAQLMTDALQADVLDDGNLAGFEGNLAKVVRGAAQYADDTGAANAYVITPSPAVTAYAKGQEFTFKAANSCTGASTLNVNSLGVKSIVWADGSALGAADIIAGQMVTVRYDGTNFQMVSSGAFSNHLVASGGYARLPGGGIITRGLVNSTTSGTVTMPITFSSSTSYGVFLQADSTTGTYGSSVNRTSGSQFSYILPGNLNLHWFAIGA